MTKVNVNRLLNNSTAEFHRALDYLHTIPKKLEYHFSTQTILFFDENDAAYFILRWG